MIDFSEVRGHADAIAVIARSVAMGRNMALTGPPGTGKTMLARRIVTLLPPLSDFEATWLRAEYQGLGPAYDVSDVGMSRPFRAPHYTISTNALVGMPSWQSRRDPLCRCKQELPAHPFHQLPRAVVGSVGEVALARFGVLLLDEVSEFRAAALEATAIALRRMAIGRPIVVASLTPCACGWLDSGVRECACSAESRVRHAQRNDKAVALLGLEAAIPVAMVSREIMTRGPSGPSSADLRAKIAELRS